VKSSREVLIGPTSLASLVERGDEGLERRVASSPSPQHQAYVQRSLRLRAQAPTVPNEIVIEAMIKGLRPGPTAQYFARKPPQTLENLLQKMDEYIRADNDFR
jgi:hypothetical protein